MSTLGDSLRIERSKRQLSQEKAAEEVGISRYYWGELESGKKAPSKRLRRQIEQWLKTRVEEQITRCPPENEHKIPMVAERQSALEEWESDLADLARVTGIPASVLLENFVEALKREIRESGGVVFPLRLRGEKKDQDEAVK